MKYIENYLEQKYQDRILPLEEVNNYLNQLYINGLINEKDKNYYKPLRLNELLVLADRLQTEHNYKNKINSKFLNNSFKSIENDYKPKPNNDKTEFISFIENDKFDKTKNFNTTFKMDYNKNNEDKFLSFAEDKEDFDNSKVEKIKKLLEYYKDYTKKNTQGSNKKNSNKSRKYIIFILFILLLFIGCLIAQNVYKNIPY